MLTEHIGALLLAEAAPYARVYSLLSHPVVPTSLTPASPNTPAMPESSATVVPTPLRRGMWSWFMVSEVLVT